MKKNKVRYATVVPTVHQRKRSYGYIKQTTWEEEIKELMRQFSIKEDDIESIIAKTKKEIKPTDTYDQKYNRDWRKFWSLYNAA